MSAECHREGWLLKKGSENRRWEGSTISQRWFVSEGFHVNYFEAAPSAGQPCKPKGSFDLRLVTRLSATHDRTAPRFAFDVVVGDGDGRALRTHTFAVVVPASNNTSDMSQSAISASSSAEEERDAWLHLWIAACPIEAIAPLWRPRRQGSLASAFATHYGSQGVLVEERRWSLGGKRVSTRASCANATGSQPSDVGGSPRSAEARPAGNGSAAAAEAGAPSELAADTATAATAIQSAYRGHSMRKQVSPTRSHSLRAILRCVPAVFLIAPLTRMSARLSSHAFRACRAASCGVMRPTPRHRPGRSGTRARAQSDSSIT